MAKSQDEYGVYFWQVLRSLPAQHIISSVMKMFSLQLEVTNFMLVLYV